MSTPSEHDPFHDPPPLPSTAETGAVNKPESSTFSDSEGTGLPSEALAFASVPAIAPAPPVWATAVSSQAYSKKLPLLLGLLGGAVLAVAGYFPVLELQQAEGVKWPQELPLREQWIQIAVWVVAGTTVLFSLIRLFVTFWALGLGTLATAGTTFAFIHFVKPQGGAVQAFLPGFGLYLLTAGGAVLLLAAITDRATRPPRYSY
jgi:hypothetical protein